jgi:hypothetical protein
MDIRRGHVGRRRPAVCCFRIPAQKNVADGIEFAVALLEGMHGLGRAGREAAACVIGPSVVIADWVSNQFFSVQLNARSEDSLPPIPATRDTAKQFCKRWIHWRAIWAHEGSKLLYPEMAAARRAMEEAVKQCGLREHYLVTDQLLEIPRIKPAAIASPVAWKNRNAA